MPKLTEIHISYNFFGDVHDGNIVVEREEGTVDRSVRIDLFSEECARILSMIQSSEDFKRILAATREALGV